jgi:DNA-binding SARP family transcriptional activator
MVETRLNLLGVFHLVAAGTELRLPTRKAEALLACLALSPDRARSRETLIGLLWGGRSDTQARHSLSQTLFSIRRAFADAGAAPIVVADAGSIALESAGVDVDVDRFERRAAEGTSEALREAATLYRGDLLEGLRLREEAFEEWLTAERNRFRERTLRVLSVLLEGLGAAGRTDDAVQAAVRLLALDPLQESVHRELMRLYAAQGRPASALRQYESIRLPSGSMALLDSIGNCASASRSARTSGPKSNS